MRRTIAPLLLLPILLAGATVAKASILWDQSAIGLNIPMSMANSTKTSGLGPREAYGMSDITVGAGGWTIQSISVYMGTFAFNTPVTATLNVFPKSGALPLAANNPRLIADGGSGTSVPVTVTNIEINGNSGQFANVVTAPGLSLSLAAGDYWIGLAPRYVGSSSDNQWPAAGLLGNSQAVRFATPLDPTWSDNAALVGQPATDGAILIEGVVTPEPGSLVLLGLGGLVIARRRRA